MMEQFLEFSNSSIGKILIRVGCIFFIGSVGSHSFLRKIAGLFGLLTKGEKKKKIIFSLTDIVSGFATIVLSIFVSFLYSKGNDKLVVYGEGLIYGFGSIGIYQFIIEGRLTQIIKTIRSKK